MKKLATIFGLLLAVLLLALPAQARPPRSSPVEWSNFQRQSSESALIKGEHVRFAAMQRLAQAVKKPENAATPASKAASAGRTPPRGAASESPLAFVRALDEKGQAVATPRVTKELVKHLYAPLAEGRVRVAHDLATKALWVRDGNQVLCFPLEIRGNSKVLELDTAATGLRATELADVWSLPARAVLDAEKHSVTFYGANGELMETFALTDSKKPVVMPKVTRRVRSYELARNVPSNATLARAQRT